MSTSKDGGRNVEEVFTKHGRPAFRVRCDVKLPTAKLAFSLVGIIKAFETSAIRRGNGGKNMA